MGGVGRLRRQMPAGAGPAAGMRVPDRGGRGELYSRLHSLSRHFNATCSAPGAVLTSVNINSFHVHSDPGSGRYYYCHSTDETTEQREVRRHAQGPSASCEPGRAGGGVGSGVGKPEPALPPALAPAEGQLHPSSRLSIFFFLKELEIHNCM